MVIVTLKWTHRLIQTWRMEHNNRFEIEEVSEIFLEFIRTVVYLSRMLAHTSHSSAQCVMRRADQ
jgi:uncharacterized protein YndB with AHSA1/START domain